MTKPSAAAGARPPKRDSLGPSAQLNITPLTEPRDRQGWFISFHAALTRRVRPAQRRRIQPLTRNQRAVGCVQRSADAPGPRANFNVRPRGLERTRRVLLPRASPEALQFDQLHPRSTRARRGTPPSFHRPSWVTMYLCLPTHTKPGACSGECYSIGLDAARNMTHPTRLYFGWLMLHDSPQLPPVWELAHIQCGSIG
jgi:hypothetical protein